ncbi:MAG: hypothetical protein GY909_02270 [Oligoflexia bacterium]|nr:hypothetical protein [Oligoflexia bacterium]
MIKYIFWTLLLVISISCQKQDQAPKMAFVKGDCLERPLGAYTYQVAFLENNSIYAYRLGPMGKKVYKLDKVKEFQKIQCP